MSTTPSTSSTSSSPSAASFYTSNGVTRLNGSSLISGLDTQSLINALTLKTQGKINKQGQLEQKAEWKQQMYQAVQSLMVTFNSTYFSYSNTDTNIMSSKFFDSEALTSSSGLVSATGASSDAGNVVINSISSIATAATLTSNYAPSDTNITSGAIRSEWTQSSLSGKSLSVTYGGNSYTLTLDSSASLDSSGTTKDNLQSVADALNSQINANSTLSGNLQFSVASDGSSLKLSTTSSATSSSIGINANSSDSTSSTFLSALGLSSTTSSTSNGVTTLTGSAVTLDSTSVASSSLFSHAISSSSSLTFSVGGTPHTITLGSNIDLTDSDAMTKLVTDLNSQISANSDLKNANVKVSYDDSTKKFTVSGDGVSITGGSENLLLGLGLQTDGSIKTSGTVDTTKLTESYLGDTLAGTTLSVQLNGVSKTLTFNSTDKSSYSTASGLKSYLQSALDAAYGSGKVTVGSIGDLTQNGTGHLTFTTSDSTSIFAMSSSSASNVLDENGALRIGANETNRLETTKTLNQLKGELKSSLADVPDGKYSISVNGKSFSFTGDTELGTVISTINSDSDAGVTIKYSQTTNRFSITADDTGSQGKISISDTSGNLAESLFGTSPSQTFSAGKDLVMSANLGGSSTATPITRSTNSFTLDGITLNVTGTTSDKVTFTPSSNVDDLYKKISDFVTAYNNIIDKANTYTTQAPYGLSSSSNGSTESYEPLTDAQKATMTADDITKWNEKAQQGLLENDSTLNSILSDMREAMERTVSASGISLSSIGITTAPYDTTSGGKLVIDETTLKSALKSEPDRISELFTGTGGVSSKVKTVLTNYVGEYGNSGLLYAVAGNSSSTTSSSDQFDKQISDYKETIKDLKTQLTDEQNYWQTKFSTMETKIKPPQFAVQLSGLHDIVSLLTEIKVPAHKLRKIFCGDRNGERL